SLAQATETTNTLTVKKGWNLLSSTIPLPISTFAEPGKFSSIWKWEGTTWVVSLPGESSPGAYATSKGFGQLTTINPGEGFWVNSTGDALVGVTGTQIIGSLSFVKGWNLVGLKGNSSVSAAEISAGQSGIVSIWKWENDSWSVNLPDEVIPETYALSKGFGVLAIIKPSEGFWVNYHIEPQCGAPEKITVPAISNVDGNYTVSWTAPATAGVTYTLQEATNSAFTSDLRTIYTGTGLKTEIAGQVKSNTYYYRVRASKSGLTSSIWKYGTNGCLVSIAPCETPVVIGDKDWQRCGYEHTKNWTEAIAYCENLNEGRNNDWRLPSIAELSSLIYCSNETQVAQQYVMTSNTSATRKFTSPWACGGWNTAAPFASPTISTSDPEAFQSMSSYYWSSTNVTSLQDYAWRVDFYDGSVHGSISNGHKSNNSYVRCVRGGQ
ncbi:MAG: DUF1566 domain-containing protein, partial [Desulfobulbaceae bacterium]|nr:DUF1566 domain-containing protein [Desulfobulbaceae bacterium]